MRRTATATEVRAVFVRGAPCRFSVGGGLHLWVRGPGKAQWVLRYRAPDGRRRDMGLGTFPGVPLAEARARAQAARQAGRDPLAAREAERRARAEAEAAERARAEAERRTFRAAAEALIAAKRPGWRNTKHAAQWSATLAAYAYPVLGDLPVAEVDTDAVLRVLRPVWQRAPETASRLRQRIEAVLDAATAKGWRAGANPARWKGHLDALLPPPRKAKPVRHHPALPWRDMPAFMAALGAREGVAALALRFAILTAARTGEVRGMTWREVDLAARVWTVPAARMKAGRAHRVPLSTAALAVLEAVRPLAAGPDALVFPGGRAGRPLSDMALSMLVRGMCRDGLAEGEPPRWRDAEGRAAVAHGFRSTFRDWAGETRPEGREVVERALAHAIKDKAEAAYARSDLLERRRALMEAWGAFCTRAPAEVVALPAARPGAA
ncbi:bacteriophage P4 integrase [Caldovatus sediminis]|uniref:Bacteriophage P4 integrase n=1 Tax=Caldovatus sediminis TaxID=2041189 RepID=A0A8J2ZBF9_9PROT|nr:site-specific integrase [Caldovatus sediminis]GGG34057.1 bacteriophage P4 integrase [Caldovatus sediminis]